MVATHDVVVRYLRSRLGDASDQQEDCMDFGHTASNAIFDHCSTTWSVDECLSLMGDVSNVTAQWCLIGESLNHSIHKKGNHGYGSLSRASGPVTWHHNLWAHNDARNPRLGDNYGKPPYPSFDVRNNVIYDYGATCSGMTQGVLKVNYVVNYIRPWPSSIATHPISVLGPSDMLFYIKDNVLEGNDAMTADSSQFFDPVEIDGKRQMQIVQEPFESPTIHTESAQEALVSVLSSVGASLPKRDPVDSRIIRSLKDRTGKIIDSQKEVGGWLELKSARPLVDSDQDGMPDEWEKHYHLNPRDPSDAALDYDKDEYTNVEEYLNQTNPNEYIDYRNPANNVFSLTPSLPPRKQAHPHR